MARRIDKAKGWGQPLQLRIVHAVRVDKDRVVEVSDVLPPVQRVIQTPERYRQVRREARGSAVLDALHRAQMEQQQELVQTLERQAAAAAHQASSNVLQEVTSDIYPTSAWRAVDVAVERVLKKQHKMGDWVDLAEPVETPFGGQMAEKVRAQ